MFTTIPPVFSEKAFFDTINSIRDDQSETESFKSAQSISDVAQPAIQAQTRVLSGKYHYDKNIILLKIEHKKVGADGKYEPSTFEDVCYEVVSLNIKEKESLDPVELLGARTEAAIRPIMDELIKSFVKLEDARSLIKTSITQGAHELDEYASAKGQLKTITLPIVEGREPVFDILTSYISRVGKELAHRAQDRLKIPQIQNLDVLRQLLAATSFKSMLDTAKAEKKQSHEYVCTHRGAEENKKLIEDFTSALFKKGSDGVTSFKYFEQISIEGSEHQEDSLSIAEERYSRLKLRLEEAIDNLQQLQQSDPDEILNVRFQEHQDQLSETKNKILQIKSEFKHSKDLSSLVCFVKEKRVAEQRASFGSAPFTELHSEEWYRKLDALGLLDPNHWDNFKGVSKDDIEKHVQSILIKNLARRSSDEFEAFLDGLQKFDKMLGSEIDRPLISLDELSEVDGLSDVSASPSPLSLADISKMRSEIVPQDALSKMGKLSDVGDSPSPLSDDEVSEMLSPGVAASFESPKELDNPVDWSSFVDRPAPKEDILDVSVVDQPASIAQIAPQSMPKEALVVSGAHHATSSVKSVSAVSEVARNEIGRSRFHGFSVTSKAWELIQQIESNL